MPLVMIRTTKEVYLLLNQMDIIPFQNYSICSKQSALGQLDHWTLYVDPYFMGAAFYEKIRAFQIIQGPLVVVTLGIILNMVFQSMPSLALKTDQIVAIPVAESIGGFFSQFTFPDYSHITNLRFG